MENASKALIMAAGTLIGVLIISLAVYLFTSFGTTSAEVNSRNARQQLVQFNTQYTSYIGRTDLTIYNVVTIANSAKENNSNYQGLSNYDSTYEIIVKIANQRIDTYTDQQMDELIKTNQTTTKYILQENDVQYHDVGGRVRQIVFRVDN